MLSAMERVQGMGCAACLATTEQVKAILDARGVKENESCDTQQIAVDLVTSSARPRPTLQSEVGSPDVPVA